MSAHAAALRLGPLARLRQRFGRPPRRREYTVLHLHEEPRVTLRTSRGFFGARLIGVCMSADGVLIQFEVKASETLVIEEVLFRFGGFEHRAPAPEGAKTTLATGEIGVVSWEVPFVMDTAKAEVAV